MGQRVFDLNCDSTQISPASRSPAGRSRCSATRARCRRTRCHDRQGDSQEQHPRPHQLEPHGRRLADHRRQPCATKPRMPLVIRSNGGQRWSTLQGRTGGIVGCHQASPQGRGLRTVSLKSRNASVCQASPKTIVAMKHLSPGRRVDPSPGAVARRPCNFEAHMGSDALRRALFLKALRRGPCRDSRTTRRSHRPICASSEAPTDLPWRHLARLLMVHPGHRSRARRVRS